MSQDRAKRNAAEEAVRFVKHGMVVGLGTGSTAKIAVDLIGKKLSKDFKIKGMPTSIKTKLQAEKLGIDLINIDDYDVIDLAIDDHQTVDKEIKRWYSLISNRSNDHRTSRPPRLVETSSSIISGEMAESSTTSSCLGGV